MPASGSMTPLVIAPSILSADLLHLERALQACETAGADWIHVDVMDGHFVPNLTMGPLVVEHCRRGTRLPLDVHLMVEEPERLLEAFAKAGATHLTVHVEACPRLDQTLRRIRELGCKAGVTLNPATPTASMREVLPLADLVLVMSVYPGRSGQAFMEDTVAKVAEVRRDLDALGSPAWLQVDGGITAATAPRMRAAGATAFVAGNAVFHHPEGTAAGIRALRAGLGAS